MVQLQSDLIEANATDYKGYFQAMTEKQKDVWQRNFDIVALNEGLQQLLKTPSLPINIIVFSGAWCGECAMAVPVLVKMVSMSSFLTLHIIDRDKSPELYEPFMPNGDGRVPVVLFTSEDFYVITQWIERPVIRFGKMWEVLQKMKGKTKEELYSQFIKTYEENKEAIRRAVIEELSGELLRAIGIVNYSSRLKTTV